ncbi:MAG: deoxyribose-phosphate aldolase [Thermoguttaceae bacterium]
MNIAQMIDVSAVRADSSEESVKKTFEIAVQYGCVAVFTLPGFTPLMRNLIDNLMASDAANGNAFDPQFEAKIPLLGGAVGFPGGGETTEMKVHQAKDLLRMGCQEIDMVMNIGFMKSQMFNTVRDDVTAVKQAIGNVPLKVILECHYLTLDEIAHASTLVVEAGADWVKTGTGWAPTGATLENIALIKKTVGNSAKVKAAGGVKDFDTLQKMVKLGAERFGIGAKTVISVFEEYNNA